MVMSLEFLHNLILLLGEFHFLKAQRKVNSLKNEEATNRAFPVCPSWQDMAFEIYSVERIWLVMPVYRNLSKKVKTGSLVKLRQYSLT